MEVELDKALLTADGRDDLTLLALTAFGLSGRHRIIPDDPEPWTAWAKGFGKALDDEIAAAWEASEQSSGIGRAARRILVTPSARCIGVKNTKLPPDEAFNLLARPLRVLLENGRTDRAFLLAFADPSTWKRLQEAEANGWLEFATAGGIGELKTRMTEAAPRLQILRTLYLCDRDAKLPGERSTDAAAIAGKLRALARLFMAPSEYFGAVLGRRAAENYAPPEVVLKWAIGIAGNHRAVNRASDTHGRAELARSPAAAGSSLRRLYAAIALREIAKTHPDVVEVLDMKRGYGAGKHTDTTIWDKLDAFQKAALADGFGKSFSSDFYAGRRDLNDTSGSISAFLKNMSERL